MSFLYLRSRVGSGDPQGAAGAGYSRGVANKWRGLRSAKTSSGWKVMGLLGHDRIQAEAVIKYRIRPDGGDWRLERLTSGGCGASKVTAAKIISIK